MAHYEKNERYVATIDFYCFGKDEEEAKAEAKKIIKMIENHYDNSPMILNFEKTRR